MTSAFGCFSPYMAISSTLQTIFGYQRRNEMEQSAMESQQLADELRMARDKVDRELEDQRIKETQAKLIVARRYRTAEKAEVDRLNKMAGEIRLFFNKYLPIDSAMLPVILDIARDYRMKGYDTSCPLNVLLLHTGENMIGYDSVNNRLERTEAELGNIVFRRWCNKNAAHNGSILNLNYVMANIPTLVISPFMQGEMLHFTASMWEADSGQNPLIRPLFSIECKREELKSEEGRTRIEDSLFYVSTLIAGCARDSYMLMSLGRKPTLPSYIEYHPQLKTFLCQPANHSVRQFVLDEYASTVKCLSEQKDSKGLLTNSELASLTSMASKALTILSASI